MGKKRKQAGAQDQPADDERPGKKAKGKFAEPSSLSSDDLLDRQYKLQCELNEARFARERLRSEPPTQNRILWQREVTRQNCAVHKLESLLADVQREVTKRREKGEAV
mmetsp:Transcript_101272/g.292870  ORF Transcript_101272/g.292870 Transcript_101272/m.292870 type:complete len:108 (+) Transcript_101272:18-341(+)